MLRRLCNSAILRGSPGHSVPAPASRPRRLFQVGQNIPTHIRFQRVQSFFLSTSMENSGLTLGEKVPTENEQEAHHSTDNHDQVDAATSFPPSTDENTSTISRDDDPFSQNQSRDDSIRTRQDIITGLAREVSNNVQHIIQRIDATSTGQSGERRGGSLKMRWKKALGRERYRYQERTGHGDRQKKMHFHKLTVDQIWEQALGNALAQVLSPSFTEYDDEDAEDEFERELSNSEWVSPIFGVKVDEAGRILGGEALPGLRDDLDVGCDAPSVVNVDVEASDLFNDDKKEHEESIQRNEDKSIQLVNDSILEAMALFDATKQREWVILKNKTQKATDTIKKSLINELLYFAQDNRTMLTSKECNLLLANLLTSTMMNDDDILGQVLVLYEEMKRLKSAGLDNNGPDSATYRILFMTLRSRLTAIGEAAKICKELVSSPVRLNPETYLEAMRVCEGYGDLDTASTLIDHIIISSPEKSVITLGPYGIYLEMLKAKNMMAQGLELYDRVHKSSLVGPKVEDELLMRLCRWPTRSRQGETIDHAALLLRVMNILFAKVHAGERPQYLVWVALLDGFSVAAKLDPSIESSINKTIRLLLDTYPDFSPGRRTAQLALRAAMRTRDSNLASRLIEREFERMQAQSQGNSAKQLLEGTRHPSTLSCQIFRESLEIALRDGDAEAATSIFERFRALEIETPRTSKSEIYGLVVLTLIRASQTDEAKKLLLLMVDEQLEASDDLFAAVLHGLLAEGRTDEAENLFNMMKTSDSFLPFPKTSSYNVFMLVRVQSRDWDGIMQLYQQMKEEKINPSAHTIQALLIAHSAKSGKGTAIAFLRQLVVEKTPMDRALFQLCSSLVLPSTAGKEIDAIRAEAREMSGRDPRLKESMLRMIRAARVAEVEEKKAISMEVGNKSAPQYTSMYWAIAIAELINFSEEAAEKGLLVTHSRD